MVVHDSYASSILLPSVTCMCCYFLVSIGNLLAQHFSSYFLHLHLPKSSWKSFPTIPSTPCWPLSLSQFHSVRVCWTICGTIPLIQLGTHCRLQGLRWVSAVWQVLLFSPFFFLSISGYSSGRHIQTTDSTGCGVPSAWCALIAYCGNCWSSTRVHSVSQVPIPHYI